jgi:transposase
VTQVQSAYPQAQVEVWGEDEARLGLKPIVRRVWARRGKGRRPLCAGDHRYQWMYVYGFVHPQSGQNEWWLLGGVNTPAMSAVLAELARLVGAGKKKRVILVLDRAGWHVAKALVIPEGIHLFHLPASTPELQPAERLWPPLREAVANESFADLAALETRLDERCRQLNAQREFIAGCTHYHWWPRT